MTRVELVTKTLGVGIYEDLSSGEIVEAVARHGKKKDYGRLIRFLIKHKHWSPLEHVHFSFRIETSRDVSAQMIRHRSFHWQELSQRYDVIQDIMPIEFRLQGDKNRQVGEEEIGYMHSDGTLSITVKDHASPEPERIATEDQFAAMIRMTEAIQEVRQAYIKCIEVGIAKECARRGLPLASKTVVHMTGNLRDFIGFLNVRCDRNTQKEHREVAMAIGHILEGEFPELAEMNWQEGGFM